MEKQARKLSASALSILIAVVWLLNSPSVRAASPEAIASGKQEFNSVCALCHGADAKGSGPFAKLLISGAPDLTLLSQKNKRAFPFSMIVDVVEGRSVTAAHGIREMPVWGKTFREDPARGKILDILLYLESIQSK